MKHERIVAAPARRPGRPRKSGLGVQLKFKGSARLAELELRMLAGEALTLEESEEVHRLIYNEAQHRRRLPDRIRRVQGELDALIDQLAPSDRLRTLRRAMTRARDRYHALEEALDPTARAVRIERELSNHPQPRQEDRR